MLDLILGRPLGYVMAFCYGLIKNYGAAIVIFTLLSKIILIPVSVWVQKNSIKMVRLQPEINFLKAQYFGDQDRIAEGQAVLFKREKYNPFASIVPLAVQLVLLMGVIEVIYHPLNYLLHLSPGLVDSLSQLTAQLSGVGMESSSIQLSVVSAVKNPALGQAFAALQDDFPGAAQTLNSIRQLNTVFLGYDISWIPSTVQGVTDVVPVVAAVSAWALCIAQNHANVLQMEQGALSKYGMMVFSVGISLYLGWFVPVGVALYWICSNLLAILQLYLLNWAISPKKYVDYNALEESKKKLSEMESLGTGKKRWFQYNPAFRREKEDYKRFFSIVNKHLVFYAESNGFYKYFSEMIEYILYHSNVTIHYITGDPQDSIFERAKETTQIKPYYIGEKKLITLMMKMDADIVVMTTPDLENYYIKRSYLRKDIEYIYTDHGISSDNLTLRTHALDHFDTIFCVGPHQVEEARAIERLYHLRPRTLVETGYGLLDSMDRAYKQMEKTVNDEKIILVAPSWQSENIMDSCLDELLGGILDRGYRVIVRPHPQYVRIYDTKMQAILKRYRNRMNEHFSIETDFSSNVTVYTADLVITDWSNIGYEFSFTTLKPTLYINTPMKVMNPEWQKIGIQPFDLLIREQIGASIDVKDLRRAGDIADDLIARTEEYHDAILRIKEQSVFCLEKSGEVCGRYILESLQKKVKIKKAANQL